MKIKIDSDNGLPLEKTINIHIVVILIKPVFNEDHNYCDHNHYQVFLEKCSDNYLKGRNFRGKKISRVSRISLEFAKLNSREKFEFFVIREIRFS